MRINFAQMYYSMTLYQSSRFYTKIMIFRQILNYLQKKMNLNREIKRLSDFLLLLCPGIIAHALKSYVVNLL